jgi:hypothetical protein
VTDHEPEAEPEKPVRPVTLTRAERRRLAKNMPDQWDVARGRGRRD